MLYKLYADASTPGHVAGNAGVQTLNFETLVTDTEFNGATGLVFDDVKNLTVDSTASALLDAFGASLLPHRPQWFPIQRCCSNNTTLIVNFGKGLEKP